MSQIHIFIKSNCHPKPKRSFGPAAIAYIIQYPDLLQEEIVYSEGYYLSNSQRIELIALLEALSQISEPSYIKVFSMNNLLVEGIRNFQQWQNEQWVTCYAPDLWQRLQPYLIKHRISFVKTEMNTEMKRCRKMLEKSILSPQQYDMRIFERVDIVDYLDLMDEMQEKLQKKYQELSNVIDLVSNRVNKAVVSKYE